MKLKQPFQFQSLGLQMTLLTLIVLLIFTVALGITTSRLVSDWLEIQAVANLNALASARKVAIETRLEHLSGHLNGFTQPNLETDVATFLAAPDAQKERFYLELTNNLHREQTAVPMLVWAKIATSQGMVIAATNPHLEGEQIQPTSIFQAGLERKTISDPFVENGKIYLDLAAPLYNAQNDVIAVLILRFDARDLLAITGDYTGLGQTGETVLGVRRGEQIYFLVPLRFVPNYQDLQPTSVDGERAKPMLYATNGQSGSIQAPDYRGEPVIAAYRPLNDISWGLVVKQDEQELFSGITRLKQNLYFGLGLLLLIAGTSIFPLANLLTRPLRDLEQATNRVAAGDLTIHVSTNQNDEVGRLAQSFNAMVAQLSEAYQDLERRNQELSSFAYVVSHDLKAPLRGIASLSEWLEEDLVDKLDSDQHWQMSMLRERVHRMDALINGLLEYSRVGRVKNAWSSVDVGLLLGKIVDTIAPPKTVTVTIDPVMPIIRTDELRLSQVFQNLVENAVKYMPEQQGTVRVACQDADQFWEFAVIDNGNGIEPRHHSKIFQMFQSLQINEEVDSTGIGLALAKKVIEQHTGKIWVESEGKPGQGAAFKFTWPKEQKE